MGCGTSRADNSPLVALCRERRGLIRDAADSRYALVYAHTNYFRSLASVGDALHRFVNEELAIATSPPASPVLTIPSSEGKRTRSKPGGSPAGNGGASVGGGSSSPVTPLSHSLSPEGSHLQLSSPSGSESGDQVDRHDSGSPPPHSAGSSPNHQYMRSSTAIPTMVYEDPYAAAQWSNYPPPGYGYDYGYGYGYPPYGVPIGSSPARDDAYYNERQPRPEAGTPPPPPPSQGSAWDFFNPFFGSDEQDQPGYYQGRYGMESVVSSPNSSEVRAQEGIPDLEDEMEQVPVKKVKKSKKVGDEDVGTSKAGPGKKGKDEAVGLEEKESKSSSPEMKSSSPEIKSSSPEIESQSSSAEKESKNSSVSSLAKSNEVGGSGAKRKGVNFDGESSLVTEKSRRSNENTLSAHGTRDVMEVVDEIKEQFKLAAGLGDEVARMLEVGRLPHQSGCGNCSVSYSRILDLMVPSSSASLRPSFKRQQLSGASSLKNAVTKEHIGMKSGDLSSTLEKLYMWEKKLYKEVKDEEKLRIMYDKKCRQLKTLDDRGAESYKIDSSRASIRNLRTKISVVIKSIDAISSRMHKIRDEELQPQLIELIQGLIRMWKSVLHCHQKQFQAIVDSKSHKLMAKTSIQRSSVAKATVELEKELLNWCSCFNNWIITQKAYIEALNGWLMKWLLQEQEVTQDGVVPFSPSRVGAPAAFIISNDWYHAIERISEVEVTKAMHTYAASVRKLWECQNEERRQKLKAEYLSRDFATRLKSLQNDNGMNGHLALVSADEGLGNHDARMVALDSMRKRLEEERAKHEETLKEVQEVASSSLRMGLIPIFEALENFTLETVKAYEDLRIPNDSRGT